MKGSRLCALVLVLLLLMGLAAGLSQAQGPEPQDAAALLSAGCVASGVYDPACDVNRDDTINIVDIQLTASHWGQAGTWTSGSWDLAGNAGTDPATNFLGTTDAVALELRVNNQRALRLEPNATSPNVIGGFSGNSLTAGVVGGTISGGGAMSDPPLSNRVTDDYGSIGGGGNNQAGDNAGTTGDRPSATVGGGWNNTASGRESTVSGGQDNTASGNRATVGGGWNNTANGEYATIGGGSSNTTSDARATVGGGGSNVASGIGSTVGGGGGNAASGFESTVGGGGGNAAGGVHATVPGGFSNTATGAYSFAAGRRAKANHDGTFVWADSTDADFASTGNDQFLIRASGGVGIGTNSPLASLHVKGTGFYLGRFEHDSDFARFLLDGSATTGTDLTFAKDGVATWGMINQGTVIGFFEDDSLTLPRFIVQEGGNVGIGVAGAGNILTVQQNSATDPIADAWTTYSSKRWKTNIKSLEGALDKVLRLRGVSFDWQTDGKHDVGLIAEEVGQVVPEVVAYEANGEDARSVDYSRLVAVLIEAVKEQQKEIEEQEATIAILAERLEALEQATAGSRAQTRSTQVGMWLALGGLMTSGLALGWRQKAVVRTNNS